MAERWWIEEGFVVGSPIDSQAGLERDGNEIRLIRPHVGLVLRLNTTRTRQEPSDDLLRLVNSDESIDVSLSRWC